jgi:hypothetical protein
MSRKALIMIFALALVAAFAASPAMAETKIPETITIKGAQAKKPPVVFPHGQHAEQFDCVKCHHKAASKEEAASCFKCHGVDPNAPDPSVASAKENPFHIRCRGCHKEQEKGPSKCSGCHKEE